MYEIIITTKNGVFTEYIEDIKDFAEVMSKYWEIYISVNLKKTENISRKLKQ